ncbi:MAG TPA: PilX N-terminal domain-containing pilus assembly protein [Steroidobacteraceae bacterium]|jgi:type IV pilus assembly protein PilX|nr:PilX N-terminal domain-containing pilus assembly protein [Steroidobacteraceae bacterium]
MIFAAYRTRLAQRGIVLISSLLLLIVVTIIALSLFRSFGIQEKIAGNMREKQRALQAAESAQEFAEIWLSNGNAANGSLTCSGLVNANLGFGQICSNKLPLVVADVTNVPWQLNGAPIGVSYLPTNMLINTTTSVANLTNPTYFATPTFYISDMGTSADPNIPGEIYQIDAVGYGGNSNTVAVVESTYAVYTSSSNRTL